MMCNIFKRKKEVAKNCILVVLRPDVVVLQFYCDCVAVIGVISLCLHLLLFAVWLTRAMLRLQLRLQSAIENTLLDYIQFRKKCIMVLQNIDEFSLKKIVIFILFY
ncbi:unnamed protein product [Cuscuta epithymum]|uniref:Uncharacterized protein n=1 Tax=Cuscuta epithymum TaxID=186058 RepID=A0AAV0DIX6_9ASTE|nr:unnamed protein product [Cuscuta epithymum]